MDDQSLLAQAIDLAQQARADGNHGRVVFAAGQREVVVEGPFDLPSAREVHAGFWHPA